jgi:putative N6-adenine-specific DNA methylase
MQDKFEIVVKTFSGLENLLYEEIVGLGFEKPEKQRRGVKFVGSWEDVYKANLHLRTAVNVLVLLGKAKVKNKEDLYNAVKKINWSKYISLHQTFAIETIGYTPYFRNSMFINQRAKDAIADQFIEKYNKRPNVSRTEPDLPITLHFNKEKMKIFLNTSGEPLFKRGYKKKTVKAPLNEILAAAIIKLSGWDKNSYLIDPMCGSGTIPIEAALIAYNIPPNFYREAFAFKNWKNFDIDTWTSVRDQVVFRTFNERVEERFIYGFDIDNEAVEIAQNNSKSFYYLSKLVKFKKQDFFEWKPEFDKGTVIFNPPYNKRLKLADRKLFYKAIGNKIKSDLVNYDVWIYTTEDSGIEAIGLKPLSKINIDNAKLNTFLYHFKN